MKTFTLLIASLLSAGVVAAADLTLRYEWSATPDEQFAPLPPENIKVHPDGTASVVTSGPRGFFRVLFGDANAPGGIGSVPVRTFDSLPETTIFAVREMFGAVSREGTTEGDDWKNATLPVFVTPVTSAWNDTGEPDMVEIKITGPRDAPPAGSVFRNKEGARTSPDRGFIMAGITRKSPPIVGYSTRGLTPVESLLRHCDTGKVRTIIRFGPMFLGALDSDGNLLGNLGLRPAIYTDQAYRDRAAPVSRTWNTESNNNPRMPDRPSVALPRTFANFGQLLTAYRTTPFLIERRRQLESLIEFDWQTLEGNVPTLSVKIGERLRFLEGETFTRYWLDDEDTPRPAEIVLGRTGEGLEITGGTVPGAYRLTLEDRGSTLVRYLVQVRSAAVAPRGANLEWHTRSTLWSVGTEAEQPRFDQRADLGEWCDAVGCGPVMLALMLTWAEHYQNVPSAYWSRTQTTPQFLRDSLRTKDSPLLYEEGVGDYDMKNWYEWLHDACNVACWDNGAGSTAPWEMGWALEQYLGDAKSTLRPQQAGDFSDPTTGYVGGHKHWENDSWGDDWDEAGIRVANAIKAGRPGGVYYMEHWHYALAWRYRKTIYEQKLGDYVLKMKIARHFRVNTGWGSGDNKDAVWNAYDIDGCYLLNIWQRRLPPP